MRGALEALLDVDRDVVVGVGAGGVVDRQRRLAGAFREHDLAHRHAQVRRGVGPRIDLARGRQRAGRDLRASRDRFGDRACSLSWLPLRGCCQLADIAEEAEDAPSASQTAPAIGQRHGLRLSIGGRLVRVPCGTTMRTAPPMAASQPRSGDEHCASPRPTHCA